MEIIFLQLIVKKETNVSVRLSEIMKPLRFRKRKQKSDLACDWLISFFRMIYILIPLSNYSLVIASLGLFRYKAREAAVLTLPGQSQSV